LHGLCPSHSHGGEARAPDPASFAGFMVSIWLTARNLSRFRQRPEPVLELPNS
jgi:hypothetical protein